MKNFRSLLLASTILSTSLGASAAGPMDPTPTEPDNFRMQAASLTTLFIWQIVFDALMY